MAYEAEELRRRARWAAYDAEWVCHRAGHKMFMEIMDRYLGKSEMSDAEMEEKFEILKEKLGIIDDNAPK